MLSTKEKKRKEFKSTDHPHIVRIKGVRGGRPVIKDTAISVDLIACFYKAGESVEEILFQYPHLKAAQIYDALSYYHDHQPEIESYIQANRIEDVLETYNLRMDENGLIKTNIKSDDQIIPG